MDAGKLDSITNNHLCFDQNNQTFIGSADWEVTQCYWIRRLGSDTMLLDPQIGKWHNAI